MNLKNNLIIVILAYCGAAIAQADGSPCTCPLTVEPHSVLFSSFDGVGFQDLEIKNDQEFSNDILKPFEYSGISLLYSFNGNSDVGWTGLRAGTNPDGEFLREQVVSYYPVSFYARAPGTFEATLSIYATCLKGAEVCTSSIDVPFKAEVPDESRIEPSPYIKFRSNSDSKGRLKVTVANLGFAASSSAGTLIVTLPGSLARANQVSRQIVRNFSTLGGRNNANSSVTFSLPVRLTQKQLYKIKFDVR